MPRFAIRDWTKTVRFNGSSSYLVKTSPTGLSTGTNSRYWMGWVRLQSMALACLFQFRVNGAQSPAGIIGLLSGSYYLFADTINAGNNITITAAEYRKWFPTGVPIHIVYEITNTTLYITINGVLFKTVSFGTAINTGAYDSISQGRLMDSAGTPQYYLNGFQKDCVWGNGRLSTADIEAHRLRGEVPSSAVSYFYMEDESDSAVVADGKGSNSMTINATSFFPEPSLPPRQSINENMVKNPDMKQMPFYTAATNTPDRSIDGSAGGGPLGYSPYNWKLATTSVYSGGTGYSARFDRIAGVPCIRLVSVGKIWKSGGTVTQMVIGHTAYTGPSLTSIDRSNLLRVKPNTLYNFALDYWNTQLDAGITPSLTIVIYNSSLTRIDTQTTNGATDVSTAWRTLTRAYTTPAGAAFVAVTGRVAAGGSVDFNTGNCDVAFTKFSMQPDTLLTRSTVPERVLAYSSQSSGAYAMGTITVNDYSGLAGNPATGSFTVTDYNQLVGASLDLFGFATLVEGADFSAATSNNATALSIANAINTAVGEDVTDVSGGTVTLIVPGDMNGQSATWTVPLGGGVTPTVVTMTGGVAVTDLHLASGFQPFGTDPGYIDPGNSNDECADNIAAWINGGGGVTAIAVGNVVTVTATDPGVIGNTYGMSQQPHDGIGTISNGLSFSGAFLTGGVDATTTRHRSLAT